MSDYESAKQELVAALARFLEEGEKEGKSEMQLQAEFVGAFTVAMQGEGAAA